MPALYVSVRPDTGGYFLSSLQLRKLCGPQPQLFAECFLIGLKQQTQAAELIQQVSRQVHCAFSSDSRTQKNRQQLGV